MEWTDRKYYYLRKIAIAQAEMGVKRTLRILHGMFGTEKLLSDLSENQYIKYLNKLRNRYSANKNERE